MEWSGRILVNICGSKTVFKETEIFPTNSDFAISISLQPDVVYL